MALGLIISSQSLTTDIPLYCVTRSPAVQGMKQERQGGQSKEGTSTEWWGDTVAAEQDSRIILIFKKNKVKYRQAGRLKYCLLSRKMEEFFFMQQSRTGWLNYKLGPSSNQRTKEENRNTGKGRNVKEIEIHKEPLSTWEKEHRTGGVK